MDHSGLVDGKDDGGVQGIRQAPCDREAPQRRDQGELFPVLHDADKYPFRNLHPYIRQAFDAFGPKRTFWGTDLSRLPCTYQQGVTLFTEELPWLKGQDLEWVMGRGVCEWLGWK